MHKRERQRAIIELIASYPIGRQGELARLLAERGLGATQASVSRDLEELGITKIAGKYVFRSPNGTSGVYGRISIAESGDNLIVVKCSAGLASAAAVRIDSAGISQIVGTIAGDDTIFVAVKGTNEQSKAIRALREILGSSEGNDDKRR
jgi:transcriptional regulator of arginine metabolism